MLPARCPARCFHLRNLISFDPQKLHFVNPRKTQKLYISSLRVRKKKIEKKIDISMDSLLFIANPTSRI